MKNFHLRPKVKLLIVKTSIGALTAAVIGMIIKQEIIVLDELEARYLPEKKDKKHSDISDS